ncbi:MAG: hypothetical protein ACMG6S_22065 [Byssovorax sp.]
MIEPRERGAQGEIGVAEEEPVAEVRGREIEGLEALRDASDREDLRRKRPLRGERPPGEVGAGDGHDGVERSHEGMIDDEEPSPRHEGLEEALGVRRGDGGWDVAEDLREIGERGADVAVAVIGVLHAEDEHGAARVLARERGAQLFARGEDPAAGCVVGEEAGAEVRGQNHEVEALGARQGHGLGDAAVDLLRGVGGIDVAVEIAREELEAWGSRRRGGGERAEVGEVRGRAVGAGHGEVDGGLAQRRRGARGRCDSRCGNPEHRATAAGAVEGRHGVEC